MFGKNLNPKSLILLVGGVVLFKHSGIAGAGRRMLTTCIKNIYASETEVLKLPSLPDSKTLEIPAYISLCQEWIRWDAYQATKPLEKYLFVDEDATCVDFSAPHHSMLDITAALIVTNVMNGVKYRHNCDRTRAYDEQTLGFDRTTIQQVYNTPGIGIDYSKINKEQLKMQCKKCVLAFNPQKEAVRVKSKTSHHCLAWPEDASRNKEVANIPTFPVDDQKCPLAGAIDPTATRLYHAAKEFVAVTDAPPAEESTGTVIYIDQQTLPIAPALLAAQVPATATSISIIAGPICATANLVNGQLCYEYGKDLETFFKSAFPALTDTGYNGESGVTFKISAATAGPNSRMIMANTLICPPRTLACLLPAASKKSPTTAVVLEDPTWKKAIDFFSCVGNRGIVTVTEIAVGDIPATVIVTAPTNPPGTADEFSYANTAVDDNGYPVGVGSPIIPDDGTVNGLTDQQILDDIDIAIGRFQDKPDVYTSHLSITPSQVQIQNAILNNIPIGVNGVPQGRELVTDYSYKYTPPKYTVEYRRVLSSKRTESLIRIQQSWATALVGHRHDTGGGVDPSTLYEIKCPNVPETQEPTSAPSSSPSNPITTAPSITPIHPCMNTQPDSAPLSIDKDCSADHPLCGADDATTVTLNEGGDQCFVCKDTVDEGAQDLGCPADKPICMAKGSGTFGMECAVCINSATDGTVDWGCPADTPLCRAADGKDLAAGSKGAQCSACAISNEIAVCFSIDSSGSVCFNSKDSDGDNRCDAYQVDSIGFAQKLAADFDARTDISQFSVATFSTVAVTRQKLTHQQKVNRILKDLPYTSGWTNTKDGFKFCSDTLKEAPAGRPRVLIMLTDGNPTRGGSYSYVTKTGTTHVEAADEGAQYAKDAGDTVILVGVGQGIKTSYMKKWASKEELVFIADSFDQLDTIAESIAATKICLG